VITKGKVDFTYGKVETRVHLPIMPGAFPAFWMLPTDSPYGGWPNGGEIDIVEYQSVWEKPGGIATPGSLHFQNHNGGNSMSYHPTTGTPVTGWHVYGMEWTPDSISFYRDYQLYGTYTPPDKTPANWPYNQPFHLIANLAIQPSWGSPPNATTDHMDMYIDWIRVSQRE
jgi:beta-glucanase (GH16 family)